MDLKIWSKWWDCSLKRENFGSFIFGSARFILQFSEEVWANHNHFLRLWVGVAVIFWELREFFNYATPLVIMLSFYMFQFTMLFTSWCICSDNIMTSNVAQLIQLSLTLETSLEFRVFDRRAKWQVSIVNVFFPRSLIRISIGCTVLCSIVNLSTMSKPAYY